MSAISIFEMLKIGVGPSSSHTLGPWRAVQRWMRELTAETDPQRIEGIRVLLYGSLALTGRGHCTDTAVCLALLGEEPETVEVAGIAGLVEALQERRTVQLGDATIPFDPSRDIVFRMSERLPFHANGMVCQALVDGEIRESTYYSVGGGFVVKAGEEDEDSGDVVLPYPASSAGDFEKHARRTGMSIAQLVRANERVWRMDDAIDRDIATIWDVMRECIYRGCHTEGTLPGGLDVTRRAAALHGKLLPDATYGDSHEWIRVLKGLSPKFSQVLKWVSCFALAVNEENANLGRVVTAPTNGAAGVIPAVLMYLVCFNEREMSDRDIGDFLMVAGEIGTYFKKRATISAAMGGCQAEIGVSSAMAAAALTESLGGTVPQALMAAEIAMEHHLGLTCDPVGGLVQIPCIERNSMGAIKAINAAELALNGDPEKAKVSLDDVIRTMDETARDMSHKYKETSEGGLAVNISVRIPEC
ncbi:MAG: L-serine ammonia-lyase [Rhodothermales bacterium]|nr:L-serine ammonia-lyase [Rhodothermales bacterium]MBO6778561.1 L-serine ammonia-lyase [Rhodothermales bacterium]